MAGVQQFFLLLDVRQWRCLRLVRRTAGGTVFGLLLLLLRLSGGCVAGRLCLGWWRLLLRLRFWHVLRCGISCGWLGMFGMGIGSGRYGYNGQTAQTCGHASRLMLLLMMLASCVNRVDTSTAAAAAGVANDRTVDQRHCNDVCLQFMLLPNGGVIEVLKVVAGVVLVVSFVVVRFVVVVVAVCLCVVVKRLVSL